MPFRRFDCSLDFANTDFRKRPELYEVGKGEQGVLLVEPYKGEILSHWRFKSVAEAEKSSKRIYRMFLAYPKAADFPGVDMPGSSCRWDGLALDVTRIKCRKFASAGEWVHPH